jgi:ribonuclease BN (tRNA processing enzyme)
MKIKILGVRGSIPTTSPDTKKYGGNTSCIEIEEDGWLLLLDAGSGLQNLRRQKIPDNNRIDILLTHLHMDHIQGLGFFTPLFDPSAEVHIWGPATSTISLRARLGRFFSPPLFPVYFRNLACKLFLHEIEESLFNIGPFTVHSSYIIHPGPTLGFRVESNNKSIAYMPDHEPALGSKGLLHDVKWLSGSNLAAGADLLVHDAHYTAEEYQHRWGWGHSAMEDVIEYARLNGVKHLLLTHHDPHHTDKQLAFFYKGLKEKIPGGLKVEMAVEGMQVEL